MYFINKDTEALKKLNNFTQLVSEIQTEVCATSCVIMHATRFIYVPLLP